jgi:hypothetical protein
MPFNLQESIGGSVKKPQSKNDYTEEQIVELMCCMEDPLYFMRNFMIAKHPLRGAIPFDPYSYQISLIEAFRKHRFNVVLAGRQLGKALDVETPIPTPNGWTTMGEIKQGDVIYGNDGKPTSVLFATDVMLDRKCYEVVFDNGEIIVADAEHLWEIDYAVSGRTRKNRDSHN